MSLFVGEKIDVGNTIIRTVDRSLDTLAVHAGNPASAGSVKPKVIQVDKDGKMGFFAAAPVVQQTGVSVDASGIHAALVNLGLITA